MSTETNPALVCVGGPWAGRRPAPVHGNVMYAYEFKPRFTVTGHVPSDTWRGTSCANGKIAYRRERVSDEHGSVSFWRHESLTPLDAIRVLLDAYAARGDE